jgi:transcriptional regulator with GAF, ATPase, and Fis domain
LHYRVTSAEQASQLPPDLKALYEAGGLKSFLSIPIATDHEVVGAVMIAKEQCDGFEIDW